MNKVRTALVIGGGIGGPVAAMALRKAGIEATVYEAYNDVASGVGGALSLAPNGVNALAVLGLDAPLREIGEPIEAMEMRNWKDRRLGRFGSPAGLPPQRFVWRPKVYQLLYENALESGVHIEHGKRFTGLDQSPDGVTARFADGSTASADILVGADGIRSTVRAAIDPRAPQPRYV
ncbi:MAG: FAD-dependent oxidoreductase, partial [Stackebrandtia sp.]